MKQILFVALYAVVCGVLVSTSSCKKEDEPSCKKIMYIMDGLEVTTYQWMTQDEAEETFSEFENVRIFDADCSESECLMNNME